MIHTIQTTRFRNLLFALSLSIAAPLSAQLPLQQNDNVCLIGNALADRMQHDGWAIHCFLTARRTT